MPRIKSGPSVLPVQKQRLTRAPDPKASGPVSNPPQLSQTLDTYTGQRPATPQQTKDRFGLDPKLVKDALPNVVATPLGQGSYPHHTEQIREATRRGDLVAAAAETFMR